MAESRSERVIRSQRAYEGRIANLRIDSVVLPDGRHAVREIVEHRPVVAIVPVDGTGDVVMVEQFRLATGSGMLEIPAGGMDPGESPESAAQRELQEETGLRAGRMERLLGFFPSPGFLTEYVHVFLAEGLTQSRLPADEDEDIEVRRIPLEEALTMALAGEIEDAKTIVGLLLVGRMKGLLR